MLIFFKDVPRLGDCVADLGAGRIGQFLGNANVVSRRSFTVHRCDCLSDVRKLIDADC